jgi:NAD(P) transhydrogenase subunit beta
MNPPIWTELINLAAAVAFILALKALSGPKTARLGNRIAAIGAIVATVVVFFAINNIKNVELILIAMVVGSLVGYVAAKKVQMTQMPQMVALFNGAGGGAAMAVALIEFLTGSIFTSKIALVATVLTIIIGGVAFTGSIVTFLKLQELMTSRPVIIPLGRFITIGVALANIFFAAYLIVTPVNWAMWTLSVLALILGVLFVLPVGGADVPIVISLLNAFTGLSVAGMGYVLENVLLLIGGTLVGASGTLLTRLMAQAMGRPLTNTLFGAFTATAQKVIEGHEDRTVKSAQPNDIAIMLAYASRVIIVPGYGLAVAQAQQSLRELVDLLMAKGIEVQYAIHPVAGRMPGHMNVLLAEADVPYEQLKEMDEINSEFASTDVALVVGANDVVNPAARTDADSPIYGMPILNVDQAEQVIFMKRSMRPGFAGIENELLFNDKTTLLFGDAKDSLTKTIAAVKNI